MNLLIATAFAAVSTVLADEVRHLAAENVCYSATSFQSDSNFNAPVDGDLIGIELEFASGGVTCDHRNYANTHWGCHWNSGAMMVQMINVAGGTLYPTATTQNVDSLYTYASCDCDVFRYYMTGYDFDSDVLRLVDADNPNTVSVDDAFSLQYSEGCCSSSTGDNEGTACADVYFIYSRVDSRISELGASVYDSYSTEQGRLIGWKKMVSCDEGNGNPLLWPGGKSYADFEAMLDSAIALQFLPRDSTPAEFDFTNDASDEFAVMLSVCSNPMIALNNGLTPSWTYDLDTIAPGSGQIAGQTDLDDWLGSSAAKARLSNSCTGDGATSFENTMYHACGHTGGIHLKDSPQQCVWDYRDDLANVDGISVWLGFMPQQNGHCEVVEGQSVLTIDCASIPIDMFLTTCSDEFAANELDIETLQNAQSTTTERVDAMEMELAERMDEFADAAEVMRTDITGNSQRMDGFDDTVDAVQTEVTANGERISELQSAQTVANERLDETETDIVGNGQRMDGFDDTVGAMQTNIGGLQSRLEELEAWKEYVNTFESESSARSQSAANLPVGHVASHNAVTSTSSEGKDTIIVALVVANVLLIIGCLVAAFAVCFGGKGAMGYGKMFPPEI